MFFHWYFSFQETTTINTLSQTGMYTHTHTVSQAEMWRRMLNYNFFPIYDILCNLPMDPISPQKSSGSLLYSVSTLTTLVQWSTYPGPVEEPLNWPPCFHGPLNPFFIQYPKISFKMCYSFSYTTFSLIQNAQATPSFWLFLGL